MIFEESVRTTAKQSFINITSLVEKAVEASGILEGHIVVSVPHTTAALTVNENADPAVAADIITRLDRIFPEFDSCDRHSEGNSHAHLKSSMFGAGHVFIVSGGKLVLGTWQGIFLCEFDGPRTRKVITSILTS